MPNYSLVIFVLLGGITVALATQSYKNDAMRRNLEISSNETCEDVYKACKAIPECRRALRKIRLECYKVDLINECANEKDIRDCKEAKDVIFKHAFPKKQCLCKKLDAVKCANRRNQVYANPCFAHIEKFLFEKRERQLQKEKAQTTVVEERYGGDKPTDSNAAGPDKITSVSAEFEEVPTDVFGDSGFQKPRPSRRPILTFYEPIFEDNVDDISTTKAVTETTTTTTYTIQTDEKTTSMSQLDQLRRNLIRQQTEITTDMKYRIVSIVIGSLFLFAILLGAVCIAARRIYRSSMLYKRGKIIDQHHQRRDASALS